MNRRKKASSLEHAGISGPNWCVQGNSQHGWGGERKAERQQLQDSESRQLELLSSRAGRTFLPCGVPGKLVPQFPHQ